MLDERSHYKKWSVETNEFYVEKSESMIRSIGVKPSALLTARVRSGLEVPPAHDATVTINGHAYPRFPVDAQSGRLTAEALASLLPLRSWRTSKLRRVS